MTTLTQAIDLVKAGAVTDVAPLVVAFGGTLRPGSSTEKALAIVLEGAAATGAETQLIAGPELEMAMYAPERPDRCDRARSLVEALRKADGVVIGSPGYHGSISGLVKNALDYTEDMRADEWPYFHGRPVGSVATGAGWQGAVSTLNVLRGIVHALRGWNTPLGVAINTIEPMFSPDGRCLDERIGGMLRDMGREVAQAAQVRALIRGGRSTAAA
jgi:FMN reductase